MKGPKPTWLRGELLGKGSFARVYRVEDIKTGKFYAGKFPGSKRMPEKGETTEDAEELLNDLEIAKKALRNEIQIHSQLNHPNIVSYIDSFRTKSCYEEKEIVIHEEILKKGTCEVLILEICSYKSVNDMLTLRKKLTEKEASYIMYKIGEALLYLKKQNIIHRDLKPDNIMLCEGMMPKISDFGLSVQAQGNKIYRKTGTPNFVAPEVLGGDGYSFPVDIWALGVTFYVMLAGYAPFEGEDLEETLNNIQNLDYEFDDKLFSHDAQDLIKKIFVLDPEERLKIEDLFDQPIFDGGIIKKLPIESRVIKPRGFA